MAKAGRQTSKKRARRPRCSPCFDPTSATEREWAKQLDAGRREIDRWIMIRDNPIRPPWMAAPRRRPKEPQRKAKQKGDQHQFDYLGIRAIAKEACKEGIDDRPGLFYDRVRGLCALRQPRIKVPSNRRTMGRYVGDIYRNAKRAK